MAFEAALRLGEREKADELIALLEEPPPGKRAPFLEAQARRFRGRLSGDEAEFRGAEEILRERRLPFWLAVVQLDHAESLAANGRRGEAGPLLDEARETFERLRAAPWLERLAEISGEREAVAG